MSMVRKIFFIVLVGFVFPSVATTADQWHRPDSDGLSASTRQQEPPPLLPLTEAERALDLRALIANQPDFTAEEQFFSGERFGGFGAAEKVARRGNSYWVDNGYFVFIYRAGRPVIRMGHGSKIYEPMFAKQEDSIVPWRPVSPLALSQLIDARLVALGTQVVNGHKCLKVEATKPSFEFKVTLFLAEDLKFLAIAIHVQGKDRGLMQTLNNISLSVPDYLFDMSQYTPMPLRKWERVKSAQVFVNGKPVPGSTLFRAGTEEMFLTVPSTTMTDTYILRPKERTAEVGYQGEIKTPDGENIWQTKEEIGFSGPDTPEAHRLFACREENCPKTEAGSNYFIFSDGQKRRIRVTW